MEVLSFQSLMQNFTLHGLITSTLFESRKTLLRSLLTFFEIS